MTVEEECVRGKVFTVCEGKWKPQLRGWSVCACAHVGEGRI